MRVVGRSVSTIWLTGSNAGPAISAAEQRVHSARNGGAVDDKTGRSLSPACSRHTCIHMPVHTALVCHGAGQSRQLSSPIVSADRLELASSCLLLPEAVSRVVQVVQGVFLCSFWKCQLLLDLSRVTLAFECGRSTCAALLPVFAQFTPLQHHVTVFC